MEAGPNAVLAFKREGYHCWQVSARDIAEWVGYEGFWKTRPALLATGVAEWTRSLSKAQFVRALQKLVPRSRSATSSRAVLVCARRPSTARAGSWTTSASSSPLAPSTC